MTTQPGQGIDSEGKAVVDPTKNVLDLVEASIRRQDDLRTMEAEGLRREMQLRAEFDQKLREREAASAEKLRLAESARIDAIRLVDTQQVQRAAEVQATAALALANQVSASAETLRNTVAAADSAGNVRLSAALEPMQKDIADLRRVQYETAGGKTQVVEARATTGETRQNVGVIVAIAVGFSTVMIGIISISIALLLR